MGNRLDSLLLCDLYQVHGESGYIERREVRTSRDIGNYLNSVPAIDKIYSVIVKKSKYFKYNLREIITNIPFDTIYENNGYYWNFVRGNKNEYDTFILVPWTKKQLTVEMLEKYINEHKDVNSYRAELERLLRSGLINHNNKKAAKIEGNNSDDERVKTLLRDLKRRR